MKKNIFFLIQKCSLIIQYFKCDKLLSLCAVQQLEYDIQQCLHTIQQFKYEIKQCLYAIQ